MKKVLLTTIISLSIFLLGNNAFSQVFEIMAIENEMGYLEVQMRETSGIGTPTTAIPIAQISFEIRWANTSTADVEILCSSNHYTIADGMLTKNNHVGDGLFWRNFVKTSANPVYPISNWVQNEWEVIAVFKVTGAAGTVDFDIAPSGWVPQDLVWSQGNPIDTYFPTPNGSASNYSYPTIIYDFVWIGGGTGPGKEPDRWNQTNNWVNECGNAPTSGNWPYQNTENVYIPDVSNASNYFPDDFKVSEGYAYNCNNLIIGSGAHINVPDLSLNTGTFTYFNIAGNCEINGTLSLTPLGHATVAGSTTINSATGIIVEADATGVGSFIDNGISYGTGGTAKVQTYLSNDATAPAFDFHLVGPTVDNTGTGVTLAEFNIAPGHTYAYKYNEPTNSWDNYYDLADAIPTAKGIGLSTDDGTAYTMEMTGELKTGAVISEAMTITANGTYLLSNPYPSSVFWDDLYGNNGNVYDQVYVYDGTNYLGYNITSGGTGTFLGYIQVGQGFFVNAISATAFTFANSDRHHSSDPFYKSKTYTNRLKVSVSGNESTDGLLVHFYEGAVSGYEPNEDIQKKLSYSNNATQFWTVLEDGQNMSINAMPLELLGKGMHSIPMSFICIATGNYTMNFLDIETFEIGTDIWLEDKQTGAEWISLNDHSVYNFIATPQDLEDRFVIHFFGPTGVEEFGVETTVDIFSYRQYAFVRNNTNEVIKQVNIYTLSGELLQNNKLADIELNKFWVSNKIGYYVVRVITDKNVYTNKVFISK